LSRGAIFTSNALRNGTTQPAHLGGSGVLATVAAGLYVSWNGLNIISAATRLQGIFFWEVLNYLIDGLVFLITGLQARALTAQINADTLANLAISAAIISGAIILARFAWTYPATYLPRLLIPWIAHKDPAPPWQWPFVLSFTGVRGVVSLAAALAIPLQTDAGDPFPGRDFILFLTFSVILVTLVIQGLMLPWLIRALGLAHAGRREKHADRIEEVNARRQGIEAAIAHLRVLAIERKLPPYVVHGLQAQHHDRLKHFDSGHESDAGHAHERGKTRDEIELLLISAERQRINALYRDGNLKDEARRRIERELDLREASLASHDHQDVDS